MIGYVDAPRAWWLTHGMARTVGVNLPRAVIEGWLTRAELAGLVGRCQTCGKAADCTSWLAVSPVPQEGLPTFCCNKEEIEALTPEP